jgi:hypothetical protein
MSNTTHWYIVKTQEGHCQIVAIDNDRVPEESDKWGPFNSQDDAIARRIGLIRAGKCQPI